ncbi:MAG: phytanoyl-CoA dioxygenase [Chlorogloeopsis fritschii C42_A2020_084]|uniref:phytanoyl-CoA dioxygenase n=1 Tax=Chlorogloeopsis fritschii TaxID=1124 RepID=UPI001A0BA6AF|nr:phytanoyl-CoA dioxygenase [Chlorogloeopsis fritschii]MBF2006463.1 phytanoyl-CoA dioxygenase [Chlorogloeopsis fritschii C42_A2020_084]
MFYKIRTKFLGLLSECVYRLSLLAHRTKIPQVSSSDRLIVDGLKKEGAYVTSLTELGLLSTPNLLQAAKKSLEIMAAASTEPSVQVEPQICTVTNLLEFSQWGLEDRLLQIAENHIGLPVKFQGVHLRRDFPSIEQCGIQRWHWDIEDRRVVKIIVYLNDVDEKTGPFEYIYKSLTSRWSWQGWKINHIAKRPAMFGIADEELTPIIPTSAWKKCSGPAGTVIFVDAANVLHHGTLRSEERSALFFVYTAASPKRPAECTQYSDQTYPNLDRLVADSVPKPAYADL